MTAQEMESHIVRYDELKPCKTAFIDAHTPGSDQKDNFTIIGPGVSESPDQHVHISETPGFNIGAALPFALGLNLFITIFFPQYASLTINLSISY